MPIYPSYASTPKSTFQSYRNQQILFSFSGGMAINLASIYIGNPYIISLLVLLVAVVATVQWMNDPLPWICLVSVLAANPANISVPIALNLLFALIFIMLNLNSFNKLPLWLYLVLLFSVISVLGSAYNWGTTGEYFTEFASVGNYLFGPFLLIPLVYYRLQLENDSALLLKTFIYSLVLPTVTLLLLARFFGTPTADLNTNSFDYLVNISTYHLGNMDFQIIRTQVGIPIAALICISFAVVVSTAKRSTRIFGFVFLLLSIFLLMITGSVGSSISALFGIVITLLVARRYIPIKKHLILLPILVALLLAGWSQVPLGLKQYVESRFEEKLSGGVDVSDRSRSWQASLNYLFENPLGRGWDLYIEPIRTYPHNDYLTYGIAFGFFCGLLYLFVPLKIFLQMVANDHLKKNPEQVAILLAGLGCVSVLLVNSFSDHLSANRWYFNVVWSMIWYCYFAAKSLPGDAFQQQNVSG